MSLIVEYIPGRVTETLDRLIALYRPDSLIVGTRGGKRSRMSMSMSMSLGTSPTPIILIQLDALLIIPFLLIRHGQLRRRHRERKQILPVAFACTRHCGTS